MPKLYGKALPPVNTQTSTRLYGQLVSLLTFIRTKLTPRFPLHNCRDVDSTTLELCRFRFGTPRQTFVWARAAVQRSPSAPNENVFIDRREQPSRQHRLAVIVRPVSGVFERPCAKCQPLKAHTRSTRPPGSFPLDALREARCATGKQSPLYLSWC